MHPDTAWGWAIAIMVFSVASCTAIASYAESKFQAVRDVATIEHTPARVEKIEQRLSAVETQLQKLDSTWKAVTAVESGGDVLAFNPSENARGIAQIRPIMIEDVNRFSPVKYTHDDAWDEGRAYAIFRAYCLHYYPQGTPEQWARAWNGGPRGPERSSTFAYWARVKRQL